MAFLEVKLVVEIDVHRTEPGTTETTTTSLDINEIVAKIRDFVGSIKDMSSGAEPMSVSVEGFNVAVSKDKGEYEFALRLNLVLRPKSMAVTSPS
jgi:hypothetical protein